MIETDVRGVERIARRLLRFPEPVSFLDALMLVRHARKTGDPLGREVRALVALHDAPHTTDGARDVLGDFLRGWARKQAYQETLGERSLTLRDTGKTARVEAGATVVLELTERRGKGCRWEVETCDGPGSCKRNPRSEETPSLAVYLLRCRKPGRIELTLRENSPSGDVSGEGEEFTITVVVTAPSREEDQL